MCRVTETFVIRMFTYVLFYMSCLRDLFDFTLSLFDLKDLFPDFY